MNAKRWAVLGAGLVVVLGTAFFSMYFCLEHCRRAESPRGVLGAHSWAHSIGLSGEQEVKLKPLEAALDKDLKELQVNLAHERMALCALLRDGPTDSKALDDYTGRVGALEAEQQRRVVRHLLDMRDLLTPEQKDKFFNAIMREICAGCRTATGHKDCLCGKCAHEKKKG